MSRENINFEQLSNRIKQTRKDLKLTQDKFGKRIGLRRQDVHAIEMCKRKPGLTVLYRIAVEFDLSLDWLLKD